MEVHTVHFKILTVEFGTCMCRMFSTLFFVKCWGSWAYAHVITSIYTNNQPANF